MSDQIKVEMVEWAKAMRGGIDGASKVAIDQIPEVLKEVVIKGIIENSLDLLLSVLIILAVVLSLKSKKFGELVTIEPLSLFWIPISFGIVGLAAVGGILCFHELCVAIFAPRVYILEYLAELVK